MLLSGTLLTLDKERISYYHYKRDMAYVVIIVHGFFNSKDSELLQKLKNSLVEEYDVFMFDFRGHGKSSGVFTWTSKEDKDLTAVLRYLQEKYEKIGIIAFSLGGSISINVLSERKSVDSLVCVSTPSDLKKIDYKFWELDWEEDIVYSLLKKEGRKGKGVRPGPFWLKKKRPIDSIKKIKIPVLYIHGERDWVVNLWHSQILYENTNTLSRKKIVFIKDGPHAEYIMKEFSEKFIREIRKWFAETLG